MEDSDLYSGLATEASMLLVAVSAVFVRRARLSYAFGGMFAASFSAYYVWYQGPLEMGGLTDLLFFGLYAFGLVYYFVWLPRQVRRPASQAGTRKAGVGLGVLCWVTSLLGACWALMGIAIQAASMIGAGTKPLLSFPRNHEPPYVGCYARAS